MRPGSPTRERAAPVTPSQRADIIGRGLPAAPQLTETPAGSGRLPEGPGGQEILSDAIRRRRCTVALTRQLSGVTQRERTMSGALVELASAGGGSVVGKRTRGRPSTRSS